MCCQICSFHSLLKCFPQGIDFQGKLSRRINGPEYYALLHVMCLPPWYLTLKFKQMFRKIKAETPYSFSCLNIMFLPYLLCKILWNLNQIDGRVGNHLTFMVQIENNYFVLYLMIFLLRYSHDTSIFRFKVFIEMWIFIFVWWNRIRDQWNKCIYNVCLTLLGASMTEWLDLLS